MPTTLGCPHLPATGLSGDLRALETLRLGFLCEGWELQACLGMTWPSIHSAGDVGPVGEPGLKTHPEVSRPGVGFREPFLGGHGSPQLPPFPVVFSAFLRSEAQIKQETKAFHKSLGDGGQRSDHKGQGKGAGVAGPMGARHTPSGSATPLAS